MRPELVTGAIIVVAVAVGALRLVLRRQADGISWPRIAGLFALSAATGALLYLTCFPPPARFARGTLIVATAQAPRVTVGAGERLIALPEAPPLADAERVPDLATALRRDGSPERVRVIGAGLIARDRSAVAGIPLEFSPPPIPHGLIELEPPGETAAGSAFAVGGRVNGLAGGTAELLDPAGRRIDARAIGGDGRFLLVGNARAAGMALFSLRVRDVKRAIVAETTVPLWTVPDPKLRVLAIGAPGPETKYLRRWAADAGLDFTGQFDAGGAVRLGDAPVAVTPATLGGFDAVIIDDRSWQGLGTVGRSALNGAVANGLGLILRLTAPVTPALRRDLRGLGLDLAGGDELKPIALPPLAADADALAAQRGPAPTDEAGAASALDDPTPELGQWNVRAGVGLVPLLRDGTGELLAAWRARGLGRVAVWAIADSYALVLAGQRERHFQWWSDAVTKVARAAPRFAPDLPPIARAGERMAICGLAGQPRVTAPDGRISRLALSGAGGCAAFWPAAAGLHTLIQPGQGGERSRPFYVYPAGALSAMTAADLRAATIALAAASRNAAATNTSGERSGSAWPWFLGWLAVSALLWTLERRRPSVTKSARSP